MSNEDKPLDEKIFKCIYCETTFTKLEDLENHLNICEDNPKNLYKKYDEIKKNMITKDVMFRPFRF